MTIQLMEDTYGKCAQSDVFTLATTPEEEKQIVCNLMADAQSRLSEGNLYFVVSSRWFSRWENYVGIGIDDSMRQTDPIDLDADPVGVHGRPGPIYNCDIVDNDCEGSLEFFDISRALLERRDYVLVPQKVWDYLYFWYQGGPALPRKMVSQGIVNKKQFQVEVYPLRLKLIDSRDYSEAVIRLSRKATLDELYETVCTLTGVDKAKALIWDFFNKHKHKEFSLASPSQTLQESDLQMDQEILLEIKSEKAFEHGSRKDSTGNEWALISIDPAHSAMSLDGESVLSNGNSSSRSIMGNDSGVDSITTSNRLEMRGITGLQNLGNTCFMNSAIQCLVHTPQLVEYFLLDYSDEINADNPLGMHGEIAKAFGELLRQIWAPDRNVIAPRVFKGILSQFAPQFSGYNQHDSQELLAFLLDGLHEDLNRVKRKPYIEMKDWSGQRDDEVAKECWSYHKARNDSVIVDVCQGQYKSTLVCPVCDKISITFDPFMYLSLPVPSTVTRLMTVTVFDGNGCCLPTPYTVPVIKHGTFCDLRKELTNACSLRIDETLVIAEVCDCKIHRSIEDSLDLLASVKDDDCLVAYRLPLKTNGKLKLEIVHKEIASLDGKMCANGRFFGAPLITYLGTDSPNGADIEDAVTKLLAPFRRGSSSQDNEHGIVSPSESFADADGGNYVEYAGMTLGLFLTDNRYSEAKIIEKNSEIKSGNRVRVIVGWRKEEQEMYDWSSTKYLPVVYNKSSFGSKKPKPESVSLFSCLEAFLKAEPLGPNDMWYCPGCKEHRQASKKLDLWMLPEIVVFHLKRFSCNRFFKNKLETFVEFPLRNLDLKKYVKKETSESFNYELYAVCCHYGGLGGGHYSALAKVTNENKWYCFDDSHVSAVAEADIQSPSAYVLFYRRVPPK